MRIAVVLYSLLFAVVLTKKCKVRGAAPPVLEQKPAVQAAPVENPKPAPKPAPKPVDKYTPQVVEEAASKGVSESESYPTSGLDLKKQEALNLHNAARQDLKLSPLIWDGALEASARRYANILFANDPAGLTLKHEDQSAQGENLYASSAETSLAAGTLAWLNEKKLYSYGVKVGDDSGPYSFHEYGHYTQIIMKNLKKVGCASDDKQHRYIVCRYDSMQITGQLPY